MGNRLLIAVTIFLLIVDIIAGTASSINTSSFCTAANGICPTYSLNFAFTSTNPTAANRILSPTMLNCTGITSSAITMKSSVAFVSAQYLFNDVNQTMTGPILVTVEASTIAPATTFSSGVCATPTATRTLSLALPFQNKNFGVAFAFSLPLIIGSTYYFSIYITMSSSFTGHIQCNSLGSQSSVQAIDLR